MLWQYNDGGRSRAGFKGLAGDCVVRAIAIAWDRPYIEIYDEINNQAKFEKITKNKPKRSSSRNGVFKDTYHPYLLNHGWLWTPTMFVGQGCKVHLRKNELPSGRLIVSVSRHMVAVINGVLHDTSDCTRDGTRCVYGYYRRQT